MKRFILRLRHRGILSRRNFFILTTSVNIFFLLIIGLNTLSFPNTFVGNTNLGLQTRRSIQSYLSQTIKKPVTVVLNSHDYTLTYEHLGLYINPDNAVNEIFKPNKLPLITGLQTFITQIVHPRIVTIPVDVTQEFYEYIAKVNEEGSKNRSIVYVNQDNKQVTLFTPEQHYMVDTRGFLEALQAHLGSIDHPLIVPLVEKPNILETTVDTANKKLLTAYATPLSLVVGLNGENKFLTLSTDDLRQYTTATLSAETNDIIFTIHTALFYPALTTALSAYKTSFNAVTAFEHIGEGIREALAERYAGNTTESIRISIDNGPNSNGDIAEKYIEIDISQQKLFTFKSKNLVKSYRVSTGKDYPTPIGKFQILNKAGVGYSAIYHVWMPYWMGFSFSDKLHAYFGIHELPYYYSGNNKIQRPREFIGAPNTGGCVALDIGDSKEVYQFADIGTPVVIYQ